MSRVPASHAKLRDYQGSAVYVTGGSMGIGLAAARAFAEQGADVLLFARRREPLEAAAREVERSRRSDAQRVDFRTLDVCAVGAVAAAMSEAVSSFGAPDVLFNCAGRAQPGYFEEIPPGQLEEIMQVNLFGSWNTVQALLPHMKGRGGTIVNTSSLAGLVGVFGYTDYCAAKFAVIGFSEALRSELARHGIRVFVLCPPDTETPGLHEENRTKPPETRAVSAGARCLGADEVAATLLRGIERRSLLIIPGREARWIALAKRLFPRLVERITARAVARAATSGSSAPAG
jgi:NAD(P)-dependent dehydrogenase (short-subunit alcohol dehydrogenase family)